MRDFWPAPIASSLRRFRDEEAGGITALSLQMLLTTLVIGGLAVDFGVGMASKNQLHVAADSAAHAAIYSRELNTESEAKTIAVDVASSVHRNPEVFGRLTTDHEYTALTTRVPPGK